MSIEQTPEKAPRAAWRRDCECEWCHQPARLLVGVRIVPGFDDVRMTAYLCLSCRLSWRNDEYACLASDYERPRRAIAAFA